MKLMKLSSFIIFLTFLTFSIKFCSATTINITINEVMPHTNNPWGAEWIELYNEENFTVNLINWLIGDKNSNDTINLTIPAKGYALIVDENVSFNNKTGCEAFNILKESCQELDVIGYRGLNDKNDSVFLYDNSSKLVSNFSWNKKINSEGKSFCFCNNSYKTCFPTPGKENDCSGSSEKKFQLLYPSTVECNENFTITIVVDGFENAVYDVKIDIKDVVTEKRIGKVWNRTRWISTYSYVKQALEVQNGTGEISLWFKIEDFNGTAILLPKLRKTGSSKVETFEERYIDVNCKDKSEESFLEITEAPESARFGEIIEVSLDVYRGDTAKHTVYVYVQDMEKRKVSEKVALHFDEKFRSYKASVQLPLKCLNESGYYEIVAEGLGTKDKEKIILYSCEEKNESDFKDIIFSFKVPNTIKNRLDVTLTLTSRSTEKRKFFVYFSLCNNLCYEIETVSLEILPFQTKTIEISKYIELSPGNYILQITVFDDKNKEEKTFYFGTRVKEEKQEIERNSSYSLATKKIYEKSFSLLENLPYIIVSIASAFVLYLIIKRF